jgi:F0F1-type ATP synthase assembly protein I
MSEEPHKKTSDREYYLFALKIAGDFGVAIAAPVIVFVLLGQYLDDRYEKGPWFTVGAFVLAALTSARIIYKKAKKYNQEFQNLDEKK